MKERPILFSSPMVKAILDGRKTLTRRIVKPQLPMGSSYCSRCFDDIGFCECIFQGTNDQIDKAVSRATRSLTLESCPYGKPGDQLWVKESWMPELPPNLVYDAEGLPPGQWPEYLKKEAILHYRATSTIGDGWKWKPSRFMPRWASRIQLEVEGVRVERLQDISEEDAIAEGIERMRSGRGFYDPTQGKGAVHLGNYFTSAVEAYAALWNDINASPKPVKDSDGKISHYESYPWEEIRETRTYRGKPWIVIGNPFVWAVASKVVAP